MKAQLYMKTKEFARKIDDKTQILSLFCHENLEDVIYFENH